MVPARGVIMVEMDTEMYGLIVLIVEVFAVFVAGKLQARKAFSQEVPAL
jgi:hypothetical protein